MFTVCDYMFQYLDREKATQTMHTVTIYDLAGRSISFDVFSLTVDAMINSEHTKCRSLDTKDLLEEERRRAYKEKKELELVQKNLEAKIKALQAKHKTIEQNDDWLDGHQDMLVDKIYLDYQKDWEKHKRLIEKESMRAISETRFIDMTDAPEATFYLYKQLYRYQLLEIQRRANRQNRIEKILKGQPSSNRTTSSAIQLIRDHMNDGSTKQQISK